ncbi:MAG: T9SS type A sorting domain-containing protein [Calditrichaceae bacterium]|nr:T9SS type A sorting domain-containing protein [Calditrichaceae bacterium]
MKNPYRNNRFIIPLFISFFIIWAVIVYARSTGITGRTQLGSTQGCTCHDASPNASVTVTISGPTELNVNQTGSYAVTIAGGPLSAAGTNIATDNGTLAPVDGSLKLETGELTHTAPKAPGDNVVRFEFDYTAPANPGEATIFANGNSVNLSGDNTGDSWNFADNFGISINPASAIVNEPNVIPGNFELDQNYPNPFNPTTTIKYMVGIQNSTFQRVDLSVFNLLGEQIATLVSELQTAGNYQVNFDGSNLQSGTYFYVLTVDGQMQSRQMTLIK